MEMTLDSLRAFCVSVLPGLEERDRRRVVGGLALSLGWGGQARLVEASGMSSATVFKAIQEARGVVAEPAEEGRQRRAGAGRPSRIDEQPGLLMALDELVGEEARGHPEGALRWSSKSTYHLQDELRGQGFEISAETIRELLPQMGYSLQAPVKTKEGRQHADRDDQFRYINDMADGFLGDDEPVVSVDTKKKELVGEYHNKGQEWRPEGEPVLVNGHDFPDPEMPKAVPYGVYDVLNNEGWMSVGDSGDTAEFAVASLRRWWTEMGSQRFPNATRLMITADGGGSNGYRVRAWKKHLADFAAETGLHVTVCHYPPGTSKWNRIEHRMFSFVSMNWRGKPLTSFRTIVELISATSTSTGLSIRADHDGRYYPTGTKITDAQMKALPLDPHTDWHPEWNYTIHPTKSRA